MNALVAQQLLYYSASDESAVRPRRQSDLFYGEHFVISCFYWRANSPGCALPGDGMSLRKPRIWTRQLNDRILIILGGDRSRMTGLNFSSCTPPVWGKHVSTPDLGIK